MVGVDHGRLLVAPLLADAEEGVDGAPAVGAGDPAVAHPEGERGRLGLRPGRHRGWRRAWRCRRRCASWGRSWSWELLLSGGVGVDRSDDRLTTMIRTSTSGGLEVTWRSSGDSLRPRADSPARARAGRYRPARSAAGTCHHARVDAPCERGGGATRTGSPTGDLDVRPLRARHGRVRAARPGASPSRWSPRRFDVLAFLVTHHDRVVTKEELLDEVWGDRFVSESALTSRIKQARRAVGDDGRRQDVIRTVHGRGYRFVAPLVDVTADGNAGRGLGSDDTRLFPTTARESVGPVGCADRPAGPDALHPQQRSRHRLPGGRRRARPPVHPGLRVEHRPAVGAPGDGRLLSAVGVVQPADPLRQAGHRRLRAGHRRPHPEPRGAHGRRPRRARCRRVRAGHALRHLRGRPLVAADGGDVSRARRAAGALRHVRHRSVRRPRRGSSGTPAGCGGAGRCSASWPRAGRTTKPTWRSSPATSDRAPPPTAPRG